MPRSSSAPRRDLRSLPRKRCGRPVRGRGKRRSRLAWTASGTPFPALPSKCTLATVRRAGTSKLRCWTSVAEPASDRPERSPKICWRCSCQSSSPRLHPTSRPCDRAAGSRAIGPAGPVKLSGRGQSCRRCLCLSHSRWDWAHSHDWSRPVRRHRARSASSHGTCRAWAEARVLTTTGAGGAAHETNVTNCFAVLLPVRPPPARRWKA